MPHNVKMFSRCALACSALSCLLLLSGCNIGGAAMSLAEGPKTHTADYTPAKEPMVVLVESYARGSGGRLDADQIADFLCAELKEHNVAPIIDPSVVYDLRTQDPAKFHSMSIEAVGKAVHASQVLYVNIQASSVEGPEGAETIKGTFNAKLKIVDVKTGTTRWPQESEEGFPIEYATPWLNRSPETTDTTLREKLNRSAADAIARMLYTWKEDE